MKFYFHHHAVISIILTNTYFSAGCIIVRSDNFMMPRGIKTWRCCSESFGCEQVKCVAERKRSSYTWLRSVPSAERFSLSSFQRFHWVCLFPYVCLSVHIFTNPSFVIPWKSIPHFDFAAMCCGWKHSSSLSRQSASPFDLDSRGLAIDSSEPSGQITT